MAFFGHYSVEWSDRQKKVMLMKILKNKSTDFFRKNKHYDCVSMDTEEFNEAAVLKEHVAKDTLDLVLTDETLREVHEMILNLKKDWRDIAILYLVEQRPMEEVCQILELKPSVCRMRLSRIRKYLRERFRARSQPP